MLDERNVWSMLSGATDVASTWSSLYWISSAMVALSSGLTVLEEEGDCLRNQGKCGQGLGRGAGGTGDSRCVVYLSWWHQVIGDV